MSQTRQHPTDPGTLVLDLNIDTAGIERAFRQAAETAREAMRVINRGLRAFARTMAKVHASVVEAANQPSVVAGLEARYLVRAGADPAYAAAEDLDALVRAIMAGEAEDTRLLRRENRALAAAAALRGWCHAHPAAVPVLTWHRLMSGVRIEVTRG